MKLEHFQIPKRITTVQRTICNEMEALCILPKRPSFSYRFSDMVWAFGRSVPELCLIFNQMTDFMHGIHGRRLQRFNQNHLTQTCFDFITI